MAPQYFDNRSRELRTIDVKDLPSITEHFGGVGANALYSSSNPLSANNGLTRQESYSGYPIGHVSEADRKRLKGEGR